MDKSISIGIGCVSTDIIDKINIRNATIKAMEEAVTNLELSPDKVLIDGLDEPSLLVPFENIVKGDTKIKCIMAASIIAKIHRDRLMTILSKKFTQFTWNKNAGYGTKQHLKELISNGPTIYHRKSFEPIKSLIHNK